MGTGLPGSSGVAMPTEIQEALGVPVYIWVYPVAKLADDPDEMDLRRRGYAFYRVHSVPTRGRRGAARTVPEEMAA
ncbi:hypothetical protein [Streptomyces mirabilis]|uniref:hypothetical protein n=1 Tax=Streptomyces mirabilis TaxID=68239 RepID=UPI0036DBC280